MIQNSAVVFRLKRSLPPRAPRSVSLTVSSRTKSVQRTKTGSSTMFVSKTQNPVALYSIELDPPGAPPPLVEKPPPLLPPPELFPSLPEEVLPLRLGFDFEEFDVALAGGDVEAVVELAGGQLGPRGFGHAGAGQAGR